MSFFFITGGACISALGFLVHIIRRTFTDELNREMMQLLVSQIIFVFTFIMRVGLIFAVMIGTWTDFTRDYPDKMNSKVLTAMFPLQFLIYNIVPYCTLMLLHYRNYKPKVET